MSRRSFAALAATLLTLGAASVFAPAAHATEPDPTESCWQELDTGKSLCVDASENLADAVYATYGIVLTTADRSLAPAATRLSTSAAVTALASTVIGVFYEDASYGGASFAASVSQNGCNGYVHGYADLSPLGWNDRISSFRSYAGCRTTIFEHASYGGSTYGPYTNSSYVGAAMNDKASSIRWAA